jgi:uncharacterized protein (TIGR03790 family)
VASNLLCRAVSVRLQIRLIVVGAASVLGLGASAAAQTGANVLVVVNSRSAVSETIGGHYAAARDIPPENMCRIPLPVTESVSREVYNAEIEEPIWNCIARPRAHDRILYVVLTKDVPIRVTGTSGRSGTGSSVDSELTLLYRRRTGELVPVAGFVPNPYFAGTAAPTGVEPFSHRIHDIYLVTRLDGYTLQDALNVIDRASAATADGRFVLGQRASTVDPIPNRWLGATAAQLNSLGLGDRVVLDESAKVATDQSQVLGYYSWGSNDGGIRTRALDFEFRPGALAGMFVSTDGRTFKEPPATWRPGGDGRREAFAGTSDSLIGDLIRAGVTGVSGNVDEPYFDGAIRPDILFPAYASGHNLGEAFYAATPYLSWQTLIVGDPLCAPFPRAARSPEQIDPPIDASTELPTYFVQRQLAMARRALSSEAAVAFIRFQARTLQNDTEGARQALADAIAAEPRFILARLELAALNDRTGDHDRAIAQYHAILSYSPNNPVALNNLAYALAVYRKRPEDALPIAERATTVAKKDPVLLFGVGAHELVSQYTVKNYYADSLVSACLDTLAWVQHLLGRDAEAVNTIREAHAAGGRAPDVLWHAAVIFAAIDNVSQATAELTAAVTADPTVVNRAEIQKLNQQLTMLGKLGPK